MMFQPQSANSAPSGAIWVQFKLKQTHQTLGIPGQAASWDTFQALGPNDRWPDGVSPRLLKEFHMELAPSLMRLFNHSLSRGTLPIDWKMANV